jgi:hypothetical protein
MGKDVRGVVGMDFLSHWVLRINPDRGKVSLLSSVDETTAGSSHKLTRVDDAFFLSGDLPGWGSEKFLLDTGAVGVSCDLEENLFQWLCQCKTVFDIGTNSYEAASGRVTQRQGRLGQLTVGPFQHRGLLCCAHGRFSIIGLEYLARYVVTLDFPNQTAYLRPSRRFGYREEGSLTGLTVVPEDGRAVVRAVDPASPAALAGIEPEDVITALPDSNVDPADVRAVYSLFQSHKGREMEIWLRRDGALLRTSVVPREDWTWPKPVPEISCCRE